MSDQQLLDLQRNLYYQFGFKVDLYHDERYRGVLVVRHGDPLTSFNVIHAIRY